MIKTMKINFPITLTAADSRKRTMSGTIVSWNEKGITSAGATMFEPNSIDFSKPVKLLLEHDRTRPIGKMIDVTADDNGIQATFKIAGTIAGDDALLEAAEGLRDGFSVGVVVDDWDASKGVMKVKASKLMEVSLVSDPAINTARVSDIAASEQENSEATAEDQTKQEEKVSDTNSEAPIATEAVEAAKSEPVAISAAQPVAYTKPRSPINSQARFLEHSIKASMGNTDSAQYVALAKDEAKKALTAADDSFTTNPAFKASSVGIEAQEYRAELASSSGFSGMTEESVGSTVIDALYENEKIPHEIAKSHPCHTGVVLHSEKGSALARVTPDKQLQLVRGDRSAFGLHGRSAEQRVALDILLDPEIGIISLGGRAGTGKSALAISAGLEAVLERRLHKKVVIFRPLYAVGGQGLGYLPGTENEKMSPWAQAVFDTLGALVSQQVLDEVVERGLIEVLPLTHIRGRSLHDSLVS